MLAVPKPYPRDSQLELTLYNSDSQSLARSVSRYWFGLPQVALLGITVDPLDAYRINFRAEAGRTYYLRVTDGGDAVQQIQLSLEPFGPNTNTDTLLGTGQSLKGVIEFLGQLDNYQLGLWKLTDHYYLHLDYNGPIDLVGYVYTGKVSQQNPRYIMKSQRNNCVPA